MDYFENENFPTVKMAVHTVSNDLYHVQLVDGVTLFDEHTVEGSRVPVIARYYGFDVSNPSLRSPMAEKQWEGC